MEIRRDKPYTNPNARKMSVNVQESFRDLLERNEKAIEMVSKRKVNSDRLWKRK